MRISEKNIYIFIALCGGSIVCALIDTILRVYTPLFVLLFPVLVSSIFFLSRYAQFRWVYIGTSVLLYSFCSLLPVSGAVIFVLLLMVIEFALTQFVYKFSFVQFLVIIIFVGAYMPLWYHIAPMLLGRDVWAFIPFSLSTTVLQWTVPSIIVTFVGSVLLYPLFAAYENKHRLYIQTYGS